MALKQALRPGGRSERVQKAVHAAVRTLLEKVGEPDLTIPMIAAEARVTPSTVYRRWGSLGELMADIALERLRPDGEPEDTGTFRGDLRAWLAQYSEEMSSGPGRGLLLDVLGTPSNQAPAQRCCHYTSVQVQVFIDRAEARGEKAASLDEVLDLVVAPVIYRILFANGADDPAYQAQLIERLGDG